MMTDSSAVRRARRELVFAHERGTSLASPFVSVLPVTGAAVSVLSPRIGQSTVSATDDTARRLDELQFDLGEGPCWVALATRNPVLEPDVQARDDTLWPHFLEALRADSVSGAVHAMFAFPMIIGTLEIGAVDLWAPVRGPLTDSQVSDASALADLAAWQVLRRTLRDVPDTTNPDDTISSRREIHQATGMVLVQLDLTAADAALLLRAHAFATGRSLGDVANDVVEHRLDFGPDARWDEQE